MIFMHDINTKLSSGEQVRGQKNMGYTQIQGLNLEPTTLVYRPTALRPGHIGPELPSELQWPTFQKIAE